MAWTFSKFPQAKAIKIRLRVPMAHLAWYRGAVPVLFLCQFGNIIRLQIRSNGLDYCSSRALCFLSVRRGITEIIQFTSRLIFSHSFHSQNVCVWTPQEKTTGIQDVLGGETITVCHVWEYVCDFCMERYLQPGTPCLHRKAQVVLVAMIVSFRCVRILMSDLLSCG